MSVHNENLMTITRMLLMHHELNTLNQGQRLNAKVKLRISIREYIKEQPFNHLKLTFTVSYTPNLKQFKVMYDIEPNMTQFGDILVLIWGSKLVITYLGFQHWLKAGKNVYTV